MSSGSSSGETSYYTANTSPSSDSGSGGSDQATYGGSSRNNDSGYGGSSGINSSGSSGGSHSGSSGGNNGGGGNQGSTSASGKHISQVGVPFLGSFGGTLSNVTIPRPIGTDDAKLLTLNCHLGSGETEAQRIAREWRESQ